MIGKLFFSRSAQIGTDPSESYEELDWVEIKKITSNNSKENKMECKFKVGDLVECVDNSSAPEFYKVGGIYKVINIEFAYENRWLIHTECHSMGNCMFERRFKLHKPKLTKLTALRESISIWEDLAVTGARKSEDVEMKYKHGCPLCDMHRDANNLCAPECPIAYDHKCGSGSTYLKWVHAYTGSLWKREEATKLLNMLKKALRKEEKEMSKKEFTRDALKTGMIVEARNGDLAMVLLGTNNGDIISGETWHPVDCLTSNLKNKDSRSGDIMKVYQPQSNRKYLDGGITTQSHELIFNRDETTTFSISGKVKTSDIDKIREYFTE